jgi:hypothetical protein
MKLLESGRVDADFISAYSQFRQRIETLRICGGGLPDVGIQFRDRDFRAINRQPFGVGYGPGDAAAGCRPKSRSRNRKDQKKTTRTCSGEPRAELETAPE